MHAREKHNARCTQSNRFYYLRALRFSAFFVCMHPVCCVAYTTAWKPTFKSVFCILTEAALFQHSARVSLCQPAIGKFLSHDGWAVCEIRRPTLVQDSIKESALNKWTPVSASACVVDGRAISCKAASMLDNQHRHCCPPHMASTLLPPCKKNKPRPPAWPVLFTPTRHVQCDVCLRSSFSL